MRNAFIYSFLLVLFVAIPGGAAPSDEQIYHIPEYEQKLERVVLSLPAKEDRLSYHEDILSRFPHYSEFIVLVAEDNVDSLKSSLKGKPYADRVHLVPYPVKNISEARYFTMVAKKPTNVGVYRDRLWPQGTVWARDAFISCKGADGEDWVMVPTYHRNIMQPLTDGGEGATIQFDNDYLKALRDLGVRMQKNVPLVFDGGNVFFDTVDHESVAFVGTDEFKASVALGEAIHSGMTKAALIESFKDFFHVDKVVVFGTEKQPQLMFHLDQAMALLPGKRAAVVRLSGPLPEDPIELKMVNEVSGFLQGIRAKLKEMGYSVLDLQVSSTSVLSRRFPNAVVFTDRESGKLNVLLSAYDDDSSFDQELREKNVSRLQSRGYVVDLIRTNANRNNGGVHCLYNSL